MRSPPASGWAYNGELTGDSIHKWKKKLSLDKALEGQLDGRSTQGLKCASDRAFASKDKKLEGTLLRSYHKLIGIWRRSHWSST